jgi:hypothetical protein
MALAASLALLAGCRRGAPPPTFVRGSISVPSLLSVHPAWSDVRDLDQLIAHVSALPAGPAPVSVALPEAAFPAPLKAGIDSPASRPPPPAGSRSAATERIARLRDSLNEHSERIIDRERTAMEKRLAAEAAVERSRIKAEPPPPIEARSPADERELRNLEFEAIALESQIRVLFDPAQTEAQKKLNAVAARIKALQAPPKVREEVQDAAIEKQVEAFRTRRRAEMQKELGQREAQVESTAREAVTSYRSGLRVRLTEAAPPPPIESPAAAPMPAPSLPSPAKAAAAGGPAAAGAAVRVADKVASLREQRSRLVQVITDDIRKRVEGLAARYHWTLSPAGSGITDLTPRAADLIRNQFSLENGTRVQN